MDELGNTYAKIEVYKKIPRTGFNILSRGFQPVANKKNKSGFGGIFALKSKNHDKNIIKIIIINHIL